MMTDDPLGVYINGDGSRALITAGWDDVPHLDAGTKAELLAETPPYLRDARSKGTPSLGAGAIYPIPEDYIKVDPFPIPHHWPRAYSLDVGWNWTAVLWCAWDPDTLTKYLYAEYKAGEELPTVHAAAIKARGEWIRGVIDPAANNRSQRDGERLMADYQMAGLDVTMSDNAVSAGILKCWEDLQTGRTKVFSTLQQFFQEYRLYRRDEKGRIIKKNDHLMDDMRYLHLSGRAVARTKPPVLPIGMIVPPSAGGNGHRGGY